MGKTPEAESFINLSSQSPFHSPLQIVTGFESEVQLSFGESFKVLENSSVRLRKQANVFFVDVIRGSVERENPESNVEFQVDGKTKTGLAISAPTNQELVSVESNKPKNGSLTPNPDDEFQTLLAETLKLHQRFLEKCFIKLYEKKNGTLLGGQVNTRFQISTKGQVQNVNIVQSDFNDNAFNTCVKEVISRVQFKGYKEGARTVDFPIQINIPN